MELSCEYLYYESQKKSGKTPTCGSTLTSVLKALILSGQPTETDWPYMKQLPSDISTWTPPSTIGQRFGRDGRTVEYTVASICQSLDKKIPVLVLIKLSSSFYTPNEHGVIHPAEKEYPDITQKHAVVAVGHGVIGNTKAILVRNSWGSTWGIDGYAWLTEEFLNARLFAAAILTEYVDVSANPAPA